MIGIVSSALETRCLFINNKDEQNEKKNTSDSQTYFLFVYLFIKVECDTE